MSERGRSRQQRPERFIGSDGVAAPHTGTNGNRQTGRTRREFLFRVVLETWKVAGVNQGWITLLEWQAVLSQCGVPGGPAQ